jgi:uncharacterized protein involved in exopolysaccharide biosynthesis
MSSKDILKFGEEEETEQLMQILQTDEIKQNIIEQFKLADHYGIDTSSGYYRTNLLREYDDNITIRKTEYQAIQITVLDGNPEYAMAIANGIAEQLDSVFNKIQKERALKALALVENVFRDQQNRLKQIEDSLASLGKMGVYDFLNQSKALNQAYSDALARGNIQAVNQIKQKLEQLAKYGSAYNSLAKQHEEEIAQLVFLRSKLTEAKVDAFNSLPHKYIVNPAQLPDKKSYPVRWVIVMISTISTFIFTFFFLLTLERLKKFTRNLTK